MAELLIFMIFCGMFTLAGLIDYLTTPKNKRQNEKELHSDNIKVDERR